MFIKEYENAKLDFDSKVVNVQRSKNDIVAPKAED